MAIVSKRDLRGPTSCDLVILLLRCPLSHDAFSVGLASNSSSGHKLGVLFHHLHREMKSPHLVDFS